MRKRPMSPQWGGGQAGLSFNHELTVLGVEQVVLERGWIGQTWRDRWSSFCLVTPNWSAHLPGMEYAGDDPRRSCAPR